MHSVNIQNMHKFKQDLFILMAHMKQMHKWQKVIIMAIKTI